MKGLKVTKARELADALGMDDIDRERRVRRWVSGENAPSFDYTMLMLSKAKLLTPAAERAWLEAPPDPASELRAAGEAARDASAKAKKLGRAPSPRRAGEKR